MRAPQPSHHFYTLLDKSRVVRPKSSSPRIHRAVRPKSYGYDRKSYIVGFNHEIQTLFDHLILPHDKTHVVGVLGAGGSGKTTLAKHIYHHPQINTHFTCKLWVCISQYWDKTSILHQIWRQATRDLTTTEMCYDEVVPRLFELLSLQFYLVILDDIWSIDAWYDVCTALPHGRGKVVITTRNKFLLRLIDSSVMIVEPKQLNDEDSYELFKRDAFLPEEHIPHVLHSLGEKMVKKCKGLPLAIVELASVLRMDKRQSSWEMISKRATNKILMSIESSGVVEQILALDYNDLPFHVKQLVLYLRFFPEDYGIKTKKLIQMWIAECFLNEEYAAEEYLEEIVQRSLVEVVKRNYKGQVSQFRINGLRRQVLINIAKQRNFLKHKLRWAPSETRYDEPRVLGKNLERILNFEENSHVRSIILPENIVVFEDILKPLFVKLRLLRVFILSHFSGSEMPEEIGNLIHLRYLELSGVFKLPTSIMNLANLWTLDIRHMVLSEWNRRVLNTLYKLKELRHLYLPQQGSGWGKIEVKNTKLKTLWNARGGEWMFSEMPELSVNLQDLCIRDIKSEKQLEAVFRTLCITSNNLQTLELDWSYYSNINNDNDCGSGDSNYVVELCDMENLRKCESLEKLKLTGSIVVRGKTIVFPPNLIKLEMMLTQIRERDVMDIISKSCPHLRILILRHKAYMGSKLVCKANSFPQLERLTLEDLYNLKMLSIEESAMSRLLHFDIKYCTNLDLDAQGWMRISKIPQVTYVGLHKTSVYDVASTKFEEKLRKYRNE